MMPGATMHSVDNMDDAAMQACFDERTASRWTRGARVRTYRASGRAYGAPGRAPGLPCPARVAAYRPYLITIPI